MTTYSKSDLATRVLRDLTIIDATEIPSAADLSFVQETLEAVIDQIGSDNIVIWDGSQYEIPDAYLVALSKRVGLDIGPSFGLFSLTDAEKVKPLANAALRKISASRPTGDVGDNLYY